jgi:hypothetical protein
MWFQKLLFDLKTDIWILKFFIEFKNCYLNLKIDIWILKIIIWIQKKIEYEILYFNLRIDIWILKIVIWYENSYLNSEYYYLILEIDIITIITIKG